MSSLDVSASELPPRSVTQSPFAKGVETQASTGSNADGGYFSLDISASLLKPVNTAGNTFPVTPQPIPNQDNYFPSPDLFEFNPVSPAAFRSPCSSKLKTTSTIKASFNAPSNTAVDTPFFLKDGSNAITPVPLVFENLKKSPTASPFFLKFTGPPPGSSQPCYTFDLKATSTLEYRESPFFLKVEALTPPPSAENIDFDFPFVSSVPLQKQVSTNESIFDRAFHEITQTSENDEVLFVGQVLDHSSDEDVEASFIVNDKPMIIDNVPIKSLKTVDDQSPSSIIANSMASILLNSDHQSCTQGFHQFGATNYASYTVKATQRFRALNEQNVKRALGNQLRSDVWLGEEIERSRAFLQLCKERYQGRHAVTPTKATPPTRRVKSTVKKPTITRSQAMSNTLRRFSFQPALASSTSVNSLISELDSNEFVNTQL